MSGGHHLRGIILAAGRGSRLNGGSPELPKCLVQLGEISLIERTMASLQVCGIHDISVVVGCQADRVREECGPGVRFVENTLFATTNSLYSLWMARHLLADGFVVLNCDVVFHPRLLDDLLTSAYDDALLVAYRDDADSAFDEEEMKVKVRRGCVVDISKEMPAAEADGENLGIVKFGREGAALVIDILGDIVAAGGTREWAPRAFREFTRHRPLHAIGTRGLPWTEIDFPEDYERAKNEIIPAIEADGTGRAEGEASLRPIATGLRG